MLLVVAVFVAETGINGFDLWRMQPTMNLSALISILLLVSVQGSAIKGKESTKKISKEKEEKAMIVLEMFEKYIEPFSKKVEDVKPSPIAKTSEFIMNLISNITSPEYFHRKNDDLNDFFKDVGFNIVASFDHQDSVDNSSKDELVAHEQVCSTGNNSKVQLVRPCLRKSKKSTSNIPKSKESESQTVKLLRPCKVKEIVGENRHESTVKLVRPCKVNEQTVKLVRPCKEDKGLKKGARSTYNIPDSRESSLKSSNTHSNLIRPCIKKTAKGSSK